MRAIQRGRAAVVIGAVGLLIGVTNVSAGASAATPSAGANTYRYTCRGPSAGGWAAMQATASGQVIGNCKDGTAVQGYYAYAFSNYPGAVSEGKIWESVYTSGSFKGCGWMSVASKLNVASSVANPDTTRCDTSGERSHGNSSFLASESSAPTWVPARRPNPNGDNFVGYRVWANDAGTDGVDWASAGTCPRYANINAQTGAARGVDPVGATTRPGVKIKIRYLARKGDGYWYILTHDGSNTTLPWGFVSASCFFRAS